MSKRASKRAKSTLKDRIRDYERTPMVDKASVRRPGSLNPKKKT